MTERKKKRKPRVRRVITPTSRPLRPGDPAASDDKLRRASAVATSLGVLVLAGALGLQFFAPRALAGLGLDKSGSLALRVGGIGLVIAGWVLARARRR